MLNRQLLDGISGIIQQSCYLLSLAGMAPLPAYFSVRCIMITLNYFPITLNSGSFGSNSIKLACFLTVTE
jgi:hypothetical protein